MGSEQPSGCKVSQEYRSHEDPEEVETALISGRVFSEPEEVFDMPGLDAVVISTITSTHAPLTLKAVAKGLVSWTFNRRSKLKADRIARSA